MTARVKGRSDTGRKKRQIILDYLNQVGVPTDGGTLLTVTGEVDRRTMMGRLKRMVEQHELTVSTELRTGYHVNVYTPRVAETKAVYPPGKWSKKKKVESEPQEPERKVSRGPGHIVHRCDDSRTPIPNQRGQGCAYPVSRGFSVMSTLG
jgi:hypothetical protein